MSQLTGFVRSIVDPRVLLHGLRLAHFYNYSHVSQVRKAHLGTGLHLAPNVSLRNGERIWIGNDAHIGERVLLWAGNSTGRIILGNNALVGPGSMLTASNYQHFLSRIPIYDQPKQEGDIVIGDGAWLGALCIVVAGVTIGAGAVVAAGAVVTKDIPANSIAGGVPARILGMRREQPTPDSDILGTPTPGGHS